MGTLATDRGAFPARTFDLAVALGVGAFLLLVGLTTPVTDGTAASTATACSTPR